MSFERIWLDIRSTYNLETLNIGHNIRQKWDQKVILVRCKDI